MSERPEIELEVLNPTPEEMELLENGLLFEDNVTKDASYETIGLFSEDRWAGVRYYLTQIIYCRSIDDLIARRDTIVHDLSNLGVMNREMVDEFDNLLEVVKRAYHLE